MSFENALQLYNNKQYQEAVSKFQELLNPQDEELSIACCYYLSVCFYHLDDEASRIYYLMSSFIYGYGVAEIYCSLGYYYKERNDYERAIPFFDAARLCTREHLNELFLPDCWGFVPCIELSVCYYYLNNLRQAIYYNDLAGQFNPTSPSYCYNQSLYQKLINEYGITSLDPLKEDVLYLRKKYQDYDHPGVSLITVTNKINYITTIFENYDRMEYPKKELIIVLNNNEMNPDDYFQYAKGREHIQIYQLAASVSLGECLNFGVVHSSYDYVAKIDDDDFYGKNYLIDQMNCFFLPEISVVTKSIRFIYFEQDSSLYVFHGHGEHKEVIGGGGGTIIAKKSVFEHIKFHDVNCAEDRYFFLDCTTYGYKIFASDRFNYVYLRHINLNDHTFLIKDCDLKKDGHEILLFDDDFQSVVSV